MQRSISLGIVVVLAMALTSSVALGSREFATDQSAPTFDAGRKVAMGISMPDGRDLTQLDAFRASIGGKRVASWTIWTNWGHKDFRDFPTTAAEAARERGAVPFIWWEPIKPGNWADATYTRNKNITAGDHDSYIRDYANAAKAFGTTVLLRFAHQANADYLPWGWDYSATDDNTVDTFIAMWRHVHDVFREEGATNVKFVWTVATQTCAGDCLTRPLGYPGNRWVDYMGFTWENWGAAPPGSDRPSEPWKSMLKGFKPVTKKLMAVSRKPILAAAIASAPDGGNKGRWIRNGYKAVHRELPRVKGIMYLNVDLSGPSHRHRDWSLSGWPLKMYKRVAGMTEFKGRFK
jgi:mannan endo-1,4-beta-mannosidase